MSRFLKVVFVVALPLCLAIGCGGPDNEVRVSGVDDSVVQTPEQMQSMEQQYKADSGSN